MGVEFYSKGHCNKRSLEHTTRKLVRILIVSLLYISYSNFSHYIQGNLFGFLFILCNMQKSCFSYLISYGIHWRKSHHWLLEDHRNLLTAHISNLFSLWIHFEDIYLCIVLVSKENLTTGNALSLVDCQN